ncbi:hypothetical protein S2091_3773 [Solimicrobium silvestre]|uniref:Uncharacterized protein n=1 Tax=Solimicrobium silvestre TaxID=2099400 RepID=A0A2S9GUT8_9BURK|nr:hypothetical protein S2091_3773 [Solimicrobium silvestre]
MINFLLTLTTLGALLLTCLIYVIHLLGSDEI